jgi:hypothetical protein
MEITRVTALSPHPIMHTRAVSEPAGPRGGPGPGSDRMSTGHLAAPDPASAGRQDLDTTGHMVTPDLTLTGR